MCAIDSCCGVISDISDPQPAVRIAEGRYVMVMQAIAPYDKDRLARWLGNLAEHEDQFIKAIDHLLLGTLSDPAFKVMLAMIALWKPDDGRRKRFRRRCSVCKRPKPRSSRLGTLYTSPPNACCIR
jgi:hypothetical protein